MQASSNVMVGLDGTIVHCVPDDCGPWTNGEVRDPSERGRALLDRFPGVNPNRYCVTLEAEGDSVGEHLGAQLEAIAWMCRAWMRRNELGIDEICRHGDLDSVQRGHCPGPYFDPALRLLNSRQGPVAPEQEPGFGQVVGFG